MSLNLPVIGIIGCGAMGTALIRGLIASGEMDPENLWIYDLDSNKMEELSVELGVMPAADGEQLFQKCRYIVVAVKPQDILTSSAEWAKFFQPEEQLLISLAAGITIKFYEVRLPAGSKIIRLMPNTPCLVGEGAIAMSCGKEVTPEEAGEVKKLLSHLGLIITVEEKLMDAVTGLSGTGPAYVYLFIEVLIDAGVNIGLSRRNAADLVIQTVIGAAQMVRESGRHPAELRNDVTSPAGTSAAALAVLESGRFRSSLIGAVQTAVQRAGELKYE